MTPACIVARFFVLRHSKSVANASISDNNVVLDHTDFVGVVVVEVTVSDGAYSATQSFQVKVEPV